MQWSRVRANRVRHQASGPTMGLWLSGQRPVCTCDYTGWQFGFRAILPGPKSHLSAPYV